MSAPLLAVRELSRAFGRFLAVNEVSFDLGVGELAAIIGPNGAGKTPLYNLISGRLKPTGGSIRLAGAEIGGLAPHQVVARGVARSFQVTNIFADLSVLDNVRVAVVAHRGRGLAWWRGVESHRALRERGLEHLDALGLADVAQQRCGSLSYGDKRLVELAIVLATEPRLVMLDEPAAGMTPEDTQRVMGVIRRLADTGRYTFLLTEHDMDVVFNLAGRILVMHHGEVLADGTPEAVRADAEVRRAYLGEGIY
ncbi:MAG: ABC transporter ATP-binding protein [Candidatus Competibacterales bacterium]